MFKMKQDKPERLLFATVLLDNFSKFKKDIHYELPNKMTVN